jgi:chromate reductase
MAGSMRAESLNRRLLAAAVAAAEREGAEVTVVALRELELPVYDGDAESAQGLPPGAERLKAALAAADGLLIASPEYNHSIPGAFKNAIDWASRGGGRVFDGKTVALMGAAPGAFGAVRGLMHLRQVLAALGAWTVPGIFPLPRAGSAFDEQGGIADPQLREQLDGLVGRLMAHVRKNGNSAP